MQYSSDNVIQYNSGLGLVTRAFTSNSNIVSVAEIDTHRQDILFGTFRVRAVVPTVPGVCMGFFSYHQDSDGSNVQETDIEFLSSDPNYYDTIHYTNQPGTVAGVVDPDAAKVITVQQDLTCVVSPPPHTEYGQLTLDFSTISAFHNHRFDWMPTTSTFFVDGVQTSVSFSFPLP
jgi:beta-glucanase (GH16 family)